MLEHLKKEVILATELIVKAGLVPLNFGNVSAADQKRRLFVIKPSGIECDQLKMTDLVVIDFVGNIIEGKLKPSSDTKTHLVLYKKFPQIRGIVHTHSLNATASSQAGYSLPPFGTTHADFFNGNIPITRKLTKKEVQVDYETATGNAIIDAFTKLDPLDIPAVLVRDHGPFTWGETAVKAAENSIALELCAKLAILTLAFNYKKTSIPHIILNKHFQRKHGPTAYYGQKY
jgi:L-ribulose-5-phosphate 4-epimerase